MLASSPVKRPQRAVTSLHEWLMVTACKDLSLSDGASIVSWCITNRDHLLPKNGSTWAKKKAAHWTALASAAMQALLTSACTSGRGHGYLRAVRAHQGPTGT